MPLLGMGGETEKGTALPILPWWNAVAINDVPAQSDFYSTANGRLLNDLLRSARDADKVALLLKVWRQRLSYRLVRSAEESKIALLQRRQRRNRAAVLFRTIWPPPSPSRVWKPRWISP
ncbi:heat shock protein YegD [Klebsiella pneumoniae]|nr:heat shock protein YegD [Klebsiella pneumoniae]